MQRFSTLGVDLAVDLLVGFDSRVVRGLDLFGYVFGERVIEFVPGRNGRFAIFGHVVLL